MTTKTLFFLFLFFGSSFTLWRPMLAGDDAANIELEPMTVLVPDVSIFEVLANPQNYAGKELCMVGVVSLGGADRLSVLYSSLESCEYRILVNGVALQFETRSQINQSSGVDGKYVAILGILETDPSKIRELLDPLHATLVNGRLLRVKSMSLIEQRSRTSASSQK